jgi:excisionase family DNA binding protein
MENKSSRLKFNLAEPNTWPPLLTISQASKILNLSIWTLRKWDNEGKLKAIRFGSRKDRRYRKEDILRIKEKGV